MSPLDPISVPEKREAVAGQEMLPLAFEWKCNSWPLTRITGLEGIAVFADMPQEVIGRHENVAAIE